MGRAGPRRGWLSNLEQLRSLVPLLALLLATLPALAGMFDLFPGSWSGSSEKGTPLTIVVGPPETRSMRWVSGSLVLEGTYRVTAVKDSHHTTFQVKTVRDGDQALEHATLGGLEVRPGLAIRTILRFEGNQLDFTAFDQDISPVLQALLKQD